MNQFKIRAATLDDAPVIAYVQYHGWQQTYRGIISDSYLAEMSLEKGVERWNRNLQSPLGFISVITDKEKVIGFIGGGKNRSATLKCEGEIYALYLLKEYHGKQLGTKFFVYGIEQLKISGYQSFCVFVLKDNPTINYYKKFYPDLEICERIKIGETEYDEVGLGWSDINKFPS